MEVLVIAVLCSTILDLGGTMSSSESHGHRNVAKLLEDKLQHARKTKFVNDLLLLYYPFVNQKTVSKVLQNYSRLRDFHTDPPPFVMFSIHLSNLLSEYMNASLVSTTDLNMTTQELAGFSGYPIVSAVVVGSQVIQMRQEQQASGISGSTLISLTDSGGLNFVYCAERRKHDHTVLSFLKSLLGKADIWVGICLLVSIAGIALIQKFGNIEAYFFVTISAIISPITLNSSRSILFQIWLLGCTVLSTYHLGNLASEIISPTQDMQMGKFEELLGKNYSLILQSQHGVTRVRQYLTSSPETSNETGNLGYEILTMLKSAVGAKSMEQFVDTLVFQDNTVSIGSWLAAMKYAQYARSVISKRGLKSRRCYIGKELRLHTTFWFSFTGRSREILARVFDHITETGFVNIWIKEMTGIAVTRRVQDRSRFRSPTNLAKDKEKPKPLDVAGKFLNVIYLWLTCLCGCVVVWATECGWN